jgi:hypothetical protein
MRATQAVRDIIAPADTALWQRAMTDSRPDSTLGHDKEVPYFDPRILRHDVVLDSLPLYDSESDYVFGSVSRFESDIAFSESRHNITPDASDTLHFDSALYLPTEIRHPFFIDIDTPLGTGIEPGSLNCEVAERLMQELQVPVILKGPESGMHQDSSVSSLVSTVLASLHISQSFTAEMSMAITERIMADYDLPEYAAVYGKSRGAMVGGKKHSYANDRGIQIVHYRLVDPCVGKRALGSSADVLRYLAWPSTDMVRSLPSFAKFALEGNLRARAKTVANDKLALITMVAGTIPSLLSGEEIGWRVPTDKGVSLMHMADNPIADTPEYLEQFAGHRNFDNHERYGAHIGGIVLPRNIRRSLRHFHDFGDEFESAGYDPQQIKWANVHKNPKKPLTEVPPVAA